MAQPHHVLFLCTGNSARSIMAEAIMAREGRGRFIAYSAGSRPKGEVHPEALKLLKSLGHPIDGLRSKSWDEFAASGAPRLNFAFTVCDNAAAEECPAWPGQPLTAHWGIPDPVEEIRAARNDDDRRLIFMRAYRLLYNRISLLTNLPFTGLGRMTLQNRLNEIGRTADRPVHA